ncbi:hypothetical protein AB0B13_12340 [Streptomyces sp. NPDC042898]|uniref:hypothetical protein n=1 Tax=Streptomyces sp. NPDC042898 TaxID=3154334 RepID=UPI0034092ADE
MANPAIGVVEQVDADYLEGAGLARSGEARKRRGNASITNKNVTAARLRVLW